MPRYYFDLHNDLDASDQEGVELADDAAAHAHGLSEAVAMTAAAATELRRVDLAHWVRVRRHDGETLTTIPFEEAVRFERNGRPV